MASSQPFIHPSGLHTLADLERMKTNVLGGIHPWIDDGNKLLADRTGMVETELFAQTYKKLWIGDGGISIAGSHGDCRAV